MMISLNPQEGQHLDVSRSMGDQQAAGCNTEHPLRGRHVMRTSVVLSSIRC